MCLLVSDLGIWVLRVGVPLISAVLFVDVEPGLFLWPWASATSVFDGGDGVGCSFGPVMAWCVEGSWIQLRSSPDSWLVL